MKNKLPLVILLIIGSIIIVLFLATDLGGQKTEDFFNSYAVKPLVLQAAPAQINPDDVYLEYITDEQSADIKYKNKRLAIPNVEVSEITTYSTLSSGEIRYFTSSFGSDKLKFKLSNPYVMQSVQVGYILDIEGECRGMIDGNVVFVDCFAKSVVGDLGALDIASFGY